MNRTELDKYKHSRTRQPYSRFDYSGPLSETALLGNVAFRAGQKLEWDSKSVKATNCPDADQFIQHQYRGNWDKWFRGEA